MVSSSCWCDIKIYYYSIFGGCHHHTAVVLLLCVVFFFFFSSFSSSWGCGENLSLTDCGRGLGTVITQLLQFKKVFCHKSRMKFLLSGDVNESLVCYKTHFEVKQVEARTIDAVLCVGNFFNNANFQETAGVAPDVEKHIIDQLSGLEVPLYFIGGQDDFSGAFSPLIVNQEKKEICKMSPS